MQCFACVHVWKNIRVYVSESTHAFEYCACMCVAFAFTYARIYMHTSYVRMYYTRDKFSGGVPLMVSWCKTRVGRNVESMQRHDRAS